MSDHRKLRVWQAARGLTVCAHRIAAGMRGTGSAILRDQIIRAATSIPANIVEGCAHESPREVARFIQYSLSSTSELEGHCQIACDLKMISETDLTTVTRLVAPVRMMLYGFKKKLDGE